MSIVFHPPSFASSPAPSPPPPQMTPEEAHYDRHAVADETTDVPHGVNHPILVKGKGTHAGEAHLASRFGRDWDDEESGPFADERDEPGFVSLIDQIAEVVESPATVQLFPSLCRPLLLISTQ